jgi:anti-sigma-K factor RskA
MMDKIPKSQDQRLDDQLSEFTDQLLSAENGIKAQETMNDGELDGLKKSILRVKAAARMARPGPEVSARVRARLLIEWKQQARQRQPERLLFKRFAWPFSRLALAGSLAILLILGFTTIFLPTTSPLMGTADGLQAWAPLFILAGIALIIVLVWLDRHR